MFSKYIYSESLTSADKFQVGASLQASAFSVPHLMIGRYVTGIGTGIETSTVPMYQAELSHAHQRGRLVCSEALFVGVGIVIGKLSDYGVNSSKH